MFKKQPPRPRGAAPIPAQFGLDSLESRTLLSTNFSWVGVDLSPSGNSVVLGDGVLGADNSVTGTATVATLAGTQTGQPIDIASMTFGAGGTMSITRAGGLGAYLSQNGTDFRVSAHFASGTHHGVYDAGESTTGETQRVLIERQPIFTTIRRTQYVPVQVTDITADGMFYHQNWFSLVFSSSGVLESVKWYQEPVDSRATIKAVTSVSTDGVIRFGDGEVLIMGRNVTGSSSEDTALYFDGDASDGAVGFGVATSFTRRNADTVVATINAGNVYRGSLMASTPTARAFLGLTSSTDTGADVVLELASLNSTYKLYHAAEYDAGVATPFSTGTWLSKLNFLFGSYPGDKLPGTAVPDALVLTGSNGTILVLMTTMSFGLAGNGYTDGATGAERIGGALWAPARTITSSLIAFDPQTIDIDNEGHVSVTGSGKDGAGSPVTRVQNLFDAAGGKALSAAVLGYRQVVGVATDGDVIVYKISKFSTDSFAATAINTSDTGGALAGIHFAPGADVFTPDHSGIITITGRTLDGRYLFAEQTDTSVDGGTWTVTDLSAALAAQSISAPQFVGAVFGSVTPWGGKNVFGFNAQGQIETIWTSPAVGHWGVANLSLLASAPALSGRISVLTTTWNAINLNLPDSQGNLVSVWWAPALAGEWRFTNMTRDMHGPIIMQLDSRGNPAKVITWERNGDLHLAAIGVDGNLQLFWWSQRTDVWLVQNLTPTVDAVSKPTVLLAHSGRNQHVLYGVNSDGDPIRIYWHNSPRDEWLCENLATEQI